MTSEIHLVPNILQFYGFIHLFIQNVFTEDYYQVSFPSGSMLKNVPAMQGTWVQSLGWENLLEKEMATYSSVLVWKIPWTEESDGLQSTGLQSQTRLRNSMHTRLCQPLLGI